MSKHFYVVAMALGCSHVVLGQQVLVHNRHLPDLVNAGPYPNATYGDIEESFVTITLPAGTAVIDWSLQAASPTDVEFDVFIRPQIGDVTPAEGLRFRETGIGSTHSQCSGSWSSQVTAGEVQVGLQMRDQGGNEVAGTSNFVSGGLAWTLVVYEDPPGLPAPAIGAWGIAVMGLLVLAAGSVAFRRAQSAA